MLAQSNTFILAGYETTANTLAFCVAAIAAHPRVQVRVACAHSSHSSTALLVVPGAAAVKPCCCRRMLLSLQARLLDEIDAYGKDREVAYADLGQVRRGLQSVDA